MEERLQKILARAGYGSRRQCEELIQYGRVRVNGKTAQLGFKADAATDAIVVDDKKIKVENFNFRYIALNKPRNVLSDCDSFGERKTVHDLIGTSEHMFAVGRLDFDSEGLILMTNDGDLANKLTHPRYGHEKEYHVKVARAPDEKQLAIWRRGVVLADGYKTAPAIVQVLKSDATFALLKVILREGRKRQIREIGALIGLPVSRILRVRIGTLQLGSLKPGAWRDLTPKEVHNLKATSGALRTDKKPHSKTRMMNVKRDWSSRPASEVEARTERPVRKRRDGEPRQDSGYSEIKPRRTRSSVESLYQSDSPERKTRRRIGSNAQVESPESRGKRSRVTGDASGIEEKGRGPRNTRVGASHTEETNNRDRRPRSSAGSTGRTSAPDGQERPAQKSNSAPSRAGTSSKRRPSSRDNAGPSSHSPASGSQTRRPRSGSSTTRKPR
jgi:23S rRNA pseudouridine2605 synthase